MSRTSGFIQTAIFVCLLKKEDDKMDRAKADTEVWSFLFCDNMCYFCYVTRPTDHTATNLLPVTNGRHFCKSIPLLLKLIETIRLGCSNLIGYTNLSLMPVLCHSHQRFDASLKYHKYLYWFSLCFSRFSTATTYLTFQFFSLRNFQHCHKINSHELIV